MLTAGHFGSSSGNSFPSHPTLLYGQVRWRPDRRWAGPAIIVLWARLLLISTRWSELSVLLEAGTQTSRISTDGCQYVLNPAYSKWAIAITGQVRGYLFTLLSCPGGHRLRTWTSYEWFSADNPCFKIPWYCCQCYLSKSFELYLTWYWPQHTFNLCQKMERPCTLHLWLPLYFRSRAGLCEYNNH